MRELGKWEKRLKEVEFRNKEKIYRIVVKLKEVSDLKLAGPMLWIRWIERMKKRKKKLAAVAAEFDMRRLIIEHTVSVSDDFAELQADFGVTKADQHCIAIKNADGIQLADITFVEMENVPYSILMEQDGDFGGVVPQVLYINIVFVQPTYRNYGLGYRLYEEFGKIYNEQFNGWPVSRYFANPIAEYSFRKALANGLISEHALTEEYIRRDYNSDEKRQMAVDLRQKLPEQYQGEAWARLKKMNLQKIAYNEPFDLRTLEISDDQNGGIREFNAYVDGSIIGFLGFIVQQDEGQTLININNIRIKEEYQGFGIGQLLYKKFGEVYSQEYMGAILNRYFINPIAEYSFRKAVGLGWVPQEALQEQNIKRDYEPEDRALITDLRNKLPDHVRGDGVWAKLKR